MRTNKRRNIMSEILSQDEIDRLLTPINEDFRSANPLKTIEDFEEYLTKRKYTSEEPYGIFDEDVSICRYFNSNNNENLLEDIKKKMKNKDMEILKYRIPI
jgi:flagellar motor switch protein FliM